MNFHPKDTTVYKVLRKRTQHDLRLELDRSLDFAYVAHYGQMDKQRVEPYIMHPLRVAWRVWRAYRAQQVVCPLWVLQGALFHDVIEDTDFGLSDIRDSFGLRAAGLAWDLTDRYERDEFPTLKRAERKRLESERLLALKYDVAHIVKCADVLDNLYRGANDPKMAALLMKEKADYLQALHNETGNSILIYLLREIQVLATITLEPETK
jgi:(p)ppGpp synthase/HD superfamily hydrolase